MSKSQKVDLNVIDYHIELTAIRDFVNSWIRRENALPIDGVEIFNTLKRAVISSGIKPFLPKPTKYVSKSYYDKYQRIEKQFDTKQIPDFFSDNGDIYDLQMNLNFNIHNTEASIFRRLFSIKMMELKTHKVKLNGFFDFQLYDNFGGKKEYFAFFLGRIMGKDSNPHHLPSIADEIKQWIKKHKMEIHYERLAPFDENFDDEMDEQDPFCTFDYKKNFKIEGKLSPDQIKKFFSFLHIETYDRKKPALYKPFLTEKAVNDIFANGLFIPEKPLKKKYKLNTELRFPKKIMDYAIHCFFLSNSLTKRDKLDYLQFFGSYLEDYEGAIQSAKSLAILGSNITGRKSTRDKIKWEGYLTS